MFHETASSLGYNIGASLCFPFHNENSRFNPVLFLDYFCVFDEPCCFVYTWKAAPTSFEEFSMLEWVHSVLVEAGGTAVECCCVGGL